MVGRRAPNRPLPHRRILCWGWIMDVPFNKPYMTGKELFYIADAHFNGQLAGDGPYTRRSHQWIEEQSMCQKALLTHSCTAALEMAALLLNLEPGDEVIMPSYTFVSTANAFALRKAVPVFVDIRLDTLNIDEQKIEAAITEKTKAIVPVHYAGVGCEMDTIMSSAERLGIKVVEDAAQGVLSSYKGRALGSIGHLGAYSFHETKNIISGEGGALLINHPDLCERGEIIREKGTDRSRFFRGQVDKYTWQEIGSSFLPGELTSAFLWAQLEEAREITEARLQIWGTYHRLIEGLERDGYLRRPVVPDECEHNAHMYYVVLSDGIDRSRVLGELRSAGVGAVFHYIPLHSSPGGTRYGRSKDDLEISTFVSEQLIRLPFWVGITEDEQMFVAEELAKALSQG